MKKLLGILVLSLLWIIPVSADERFIPLELFTGGEIRNDTEIKYTIADKIFGEKRRKKIISFDKDKVKKNFAELKRKIEFCF